MAYSAAFHGNGGVNNPFNNPAAATTYTSYHWSFGVAPENNPNLTNNITTPHNTIDEDTDFNWEL